MQASREALAHTKLRKRDLEMLRERFGEALVV